MGGRGQSSKRKSAAERVREVRYQDHVDWDPKARGGRMAAQETFNSMDARGDNDVRFTGEVRKDRNLGYVADGEYEILVTEDEQQTTRSVRGTLVAREGRLFGVDENNHVTDIRTGMLIGDGRTLKEVRENIEHFEQMVRENPTSTTSGAYPYRRARTLRENLESAEEYFKEKKRNRKR